MNDLSTQQALMRERMRLKFPNGKVKPDQDEEYDEHEAQEIKEFFEKEHVCPFCRVGKTRANKFTGELLPCKSCNNRRIGLYKYGMTLKEFFAMLRKQGNACAICRQPMNKICVDHSHELGHVRGLLCGGCNTGIGMFAEDEEVLARAATYLKDTRLPGKRRNLIN